MRTIVSHLALLLEDEEQEITTFITLRLMGVSFRKSPRPSLPLKRAPPLTPTLSPSGEREETAPPRRSEPLRSKVGGPSKVFAMVLRDGTAWREESFEFKVYSLQFMAYSLYSGNFVDLL